MVDRDEIREQLSEAVDADRADAYAEGRKRSDKRSVVLIVTVCVVAIFAILAVLLSAHTAITAATNSQRLDNSDDVNAALKKQQQADVAELQKQIDKVNEQRASEGKPPVTAADVPSTDLSPDTKKIVQLVLAALPPPVAGPAGPEGPSGSPGATVTGPTGSSGTPGAPGEDGSDGKNGANGASITAVALTDCILTVTITDPNGEAAKYALGDVCGAQGPAGPPGESVTGPAGPAGADGRGIQSVDASCQNGQLVQVYTFTDGTTETDTVEGSTVCGPPGQIGK